MSNKYSHTDHIRVLAELNTLYEVRNETQVKLNALQKELAKLKELKKDYDEIPF
jgi:DNA polymerase/3'-5' exonuclease PolX